MRKIIVISMITLDGVMQAPGGPEEDTSGDFKYGGWTAPYGDEISGEVVKKEMQPAEYLLGRKTYDIWVNYWPKHADIWPAINSGRKYIFSNTLNKSDWKNTEFIKSVEDIQRVKSTSGPDLHVWGSCRLIQLLLEHDLIDQLWLKTYPLTLGSGKKLFDSGTIPAAFSLAEYTINTKGVIMANYKRAGKVKVGTIEV